MRNFLRSWRAFAIEICVSRRRESIRRIHSPISHFLLQLDVLCRLLLRLVVVGTGRPDALRFLRVLIGRIKEMTPIAEVLDPRNVV